MYEARNNKKFLGNILFQMLPTWSCECKDRPGRSCYRHKTHIDSGDWIL